MGDRGGATGKASESHLDRIASIACLVGIAPWKRGRMREMFANIHGPVFRRDATAAVRVALRRGGGIGCWASRVPDGLEAAAERAGVPLWWIEDGFIRSAGLGAALIAPASLTIDRRCPHYDPSRQSDLERILETAELSPELVGRAERLVTVLRESAITKYNLGGMPVSVPEGRRIVLVPGQVEDDRSVVLGGAGIVGMADLLARVRAREPDSFILYKPHPDVSAGLRAGRLSDEQALRFADRIIPDADLPSLMERVDVVHTLTSLAGFEALIRAREVVVHGQPFYAGWGLTEDCAPLPRRTRRRSLAELVAAALIVYPLYVDPVTGCACTPEDLVARLADPACGRASPFARIRHIAARFAAWHAARGAGRRP